MLRGRSTPYGSSSPYGAFAQHVKQIARAYDSDELPEARAKLDAAVAEIVGAEAAAEHARAPRAAHRARRRRRRRRPRDALLLGARPRRVAGRARGRRCSCSRTSTGPTPACSTCSRRSPRAFATCRCSFSRSPGRSCSNERPGWAGGLPAYTALPLDPLTGRRRARARDAAPRAVRVARGARRDAWPRPRRATRSSSRSSPRRSPRSRRPRRRSCRRASARSSPRASTRCRPTSERPHRRSRRRSCLLARRARAHLPARGSLDAARLPRGA